MVQESSMHVTRNKSFQEKKKIYDSLNRINEGYHPGGRRGRAHGER